MADHTTFRIGGPADLFARPVSRDEALELCRFCAAEGLPIFVLGGGANILVSDRGIRGMVIDTRHLDTVVRRGRTIEAMAGAAVSDVSAYAAEACLSGLEFIYAMPGSVGGSVWMNARCYSVSIAEAIDDVEYIDLRGSPELRRDAVSPGAFSYKVSPFQAFPCLITAARFRLRPGSREESLRSMAEHRSDRELKGHFIYPSAGSAFKNDPAFGAPTGRIVDLLGLKGLRVGDAAVAEYHGNVVVNLGGATARDVRALLEQVERRVLDAHGFRLEREVLLVGEWTDSE